jgi:hypothetical protein
MGSTTLRQLSYYSFGLPQSLIKLESGLSYNNVQKRTDIQVFDRNGQLFMIIECKAPYIALTQTVFEQVANIIILCVVLILLLPMA